MKWMWAVKQPCSNLFNSVQSFALNTLFLCRTESHVQLAYIYAYENQDAICQCYVSGNSDPKELNSMIA